MDPLQAAASVEPAERAAVEHALRTYCRGIDRLDRSLVVAAFHPGAVLIDYAPEPITIEAFADRVVVSLVERYVATQHRLSNITIERRGDELVVESYILAYHLERSDDGARLHTFDGRYVDRCSERDGRWRIHERSLRCDWSRVEEIDEPMRGRWVASGRAGSPDPFDP